MNKLSLRLRMAHFRMWRLEQNFDVNEALFKSADFIKAIAVVFGTLREKDLDPSALSNINTDFHYGYDELIIAMETVTTAAVANRKVTIGDASRIKEINAYHYLIGELEEKRFEVLNDKLQRLSIALKEQDIPRSLERALKPLCEDLITIVNLIIKER